MKCCFCGVALRRKDVAMWDSFACPFCHKLLRVRRNYPARIFRLFLIGVLTVAVLYLVGLRGPRLRLAIELAVLPAATISEQLFLYLLPARIESAAPEVLDLS